MATLARMERRPAAERARLKARRHGWWCCALALALCQLGGAEFHVSVNGSDQNPGTSSRPWATLRGARDGLRQLRASHTLPEGETTVIIHAGCYRQTQTVEFDARDSGSAGGLVTYAAKRNERATLTGSVPLASQWFMPASAQTPGWGRLDPGARGHVYMAALGAHGLTMPVMNRARGFSLRAPGPPELFCNGQPMVLARWPNVGEPFARTGVPLPRNRFHYSGDRPERWTHAPDGWLHGFWSQDWADFHVPISRVDSASHTIALASPPAQYGLEANRPFIAYNLLEELDQPGEYYMDRAQGLLFFWPPQAVESSALELSWLETPIVAVNRAQYLRFRGLALECDRGGLVAVQGGDHVQFEGCAFRGAGECAVALAGTDNGIEHCEIEDCGEEGVRVTGGIRATLVAGRNYVRDCAIRRTGQVGWTYKPAISLEGGCGNIAEHNLIEELPHAAILFAGNNHLIASNEIRRVCLLTGDSGAIYAGRNWGFRGNRIEFNYLHDIASTLGHADVNGVYLDDCMSGVAVFGNVFAGISGTAVFCGGGRDNIITNNLIVGCGTAHYDDDRGRRQLTAKRGDPWNLLESLAAEGVAYQGPLWAAAYPRCAALPNSFSQIQQGTWRNPEHCVFARNAGWGNRRWIKESNDSHTGVFAVYSSLADNRPDLAPLFAVNGPRPARLVADLPGFVGIPFAAIGPDHKNAFEQVVASERHGDFAHDADPARSNPRLK
jgi:hypothetical protein